MDTSSKKANLEFGEDRISSLPDEVLIHILSLLSTRDAFGTSLLSYRWEKLWALVPNLSFFPPVKFTREKTYEALNSQYMNFIDRILLLHKSNIKEFHLDCIDGTDKSRVYVWLSTAVERNVRNITISDYYGSNLQLPRSLFNCKTLESLKLHHCLRLNVPSSFHFPSLKVLHVSLTAPSKNLVENLFCSSPVLEELKFEVHDDFGRPNYKVSSPALKKLSIILYTKLLEEYDGMVTIDAPVLEILEVSNDCFPCYTLKNTSSLVKAYVGADDIGHYDHCIDTRQVSKLFMLLTGISGVKNLFLDCCVVNTLGVAIKEAGPVFPNLTHLQLEVLGRSFKSKRLSKWPIFPNLQHLHLDVDNGFCSKNLSHLLMWAPNLASLVFKKESSINYTVEEFDPSEQQGMLTCLQSFLKKVEVRKLDGLHSELKLIKYLLKSTQVLETLTIKHCNFQDLSKEEIQTEILAMPRCSKLCQVVFV